jgi:tRNA threonylcarbamoyl adenosine modification protein (Sua5/YciO/YrdC/YwlC family)
MTAEWLQLHPQNPQERLLARVVERLREGAVIAYPTDSCYALGCHLGDKDASDRIRRIRGFDRHHQFTLVCRDLSEIATYARVDNQQYRLLKTLTPGAFTFILHATRELPRRIAHERRKTIGIRIPDHIVACALLEAFDAPLISCTLQFADEAAPISAPEQAYGRLAREVDVVVDAGNCGLTPTTVLDLTGPAPQLLRRGKGDASRVGL